MSNSNQNTDIVKILQSASIDNKIPCAKVFEIINQYSFFPDIAGIAMNQNKIKITFCQLGLFGYPDGKKITICENVSDELEEKIDSQIEDGKLPCGAAWNIASEMKISKMDVTSACEKLDIKISKCQLGAFSGYCR